MGIVSGQKERDVKMRQMIGITGELEGILDEKICYIFGAGVVSRAVLTWIHGKGKQIKNVLVSDKKRETAVSGFHVINLSEAENMRDSTVIVALMEKRHDEIEELLRGQTIGEVFYISDNLYYQLEYENGNYGPKEIYLLNWIKWKLQEQEKREREERIRYRWTNGYERQSVRANWKDYYERVDFAERFQRLIRGLDQRSIETVVRIINRQRLYLSSDATEMDLYTAEEKAELKKLYDDFYALIIKLSSGLYMYRGYFLTENLFEPSVFYYKHGVSKLRYPQKLEKGIFFDVGGYIGDSAMVLQELHPERVYSFEALPQHCLEMKKNLELNHIDNVIIENMALGDENKEVEIEICGSASNLIHREGIQPTGTQTVQMRTLDEYVLEHNIQECSLIKVDIEGAEPYFLAGAKRTITTFRPVILLSIYHNEHDFFELKPLLESWNLGYYFQIYKPLNGNLTNETLLIAEVCE